MKSTIVTRPVGLLPTRDASHPARSELRDLVRSYLWNRGATVAGIFLVGLVGIAVLAPVLAPVDPLTVSRVALVSPHAAYPMGTDNLGRDVLSGVLHGARISLIVGLLAAFTAGLIGIAMGAVSGYCGGKVDNLLMRLTDLFQVLPQFFLAIVIIALIGPGIEKIIFVVGILSWPAIARLVRVECLSLKRGEFVEAARSMGCSGSRIVLRHILPNALAPAVVAISLTVGRAILTEANLGFLGLSDPNLLSWGRMLNNAQQFLRTAWWLAVFPGFAILLTVLAVNLVGDGLNDTLNPKLRRR